MRTLWIDDGLPRGLAAELRARGREALDVADLGLAAATDAAVLEAAAAAGALLVTTLPLPGAAMIAAPDAQRRRDAVHRHAHELRPGRRYR